MTSVQRELERQRERELESKAQLMLKQVFGPGKVVVLKETEEFRERYMARYLAAKLCLKTGRGESECGAGPVRGGDGPVGVGQVDSLDRKSVV